MSPGELAAVVSATGAALGGLVTAASVLTGLHWGREKRKQTPSSPASRSGKRVLNESILRQPPSSKPLREVSTRV